MLGFCCCKDADTDQRYDHEDKEKLQHRERLQKRSSDQRQAFAQAE
jgi:hypothetical protein